MKGFIATTKTTAYFFLCLFILALANDHGLRAPDAAAVDYEEEDVVKDNHRSLLQVTVTKDSVDPKLGTELTQLFQDYLLASSSDSASDAAKVVEYVAVDIAFTSILDKESAKDVLRPAFAVDFIECFQYMCSTRVPVRALKAISNIDAVQVLHSANAMTQGGSVTSEGDTVMYADVARTAFSVNGTGLMIGVISDSYNCLNGAAADIASGDLPSASGSIIIIRDDCLGNTDEGRAMMQLIHDVAPDARLAFRTAYGGQASFAAGILELAAAGCDVIVDDILYFAEPMFQDGIIAQAANQVVAQGIPYFSAAFNNARRTWDAPTGFIPVTVRGRVLHRFGTDSSGNPITRMRITVSGNGFQRVIPFQWDQPFKSVSGTVGSQSDIDIYLYQNGRRVAESINRNIVGGDPYEQLDVIPSDASLVTYELEIRRFAGPSPTYMKLIVYGSDVTFAFPTNLGASYGHANAASAAGVGAARYTKTPAFGVSPPEIESFSSTGGVPIFFAIDGSRLSSPEIRNQPRFTGPDGGATTFFGQQDSFGIWRFYGTSAAAPHVAAVAALMLQLKGGPRSLTPVEIYATLEATAVDMDDPFTPGFDVGFDFGTGYGLVNAQAALQALAPPATPVTPPIVPSTPVAPPVVPPTPVKPPMRDCTITFDLLNALTNRNLGTLTNGVTVAKPPLCGWANIEAVVPCGDSDDLVTLELYQGTNRIREATDSGYPYFLFGNLGSNVKRGKIPAGSYGIRAQVNGIWSPLTNFTLGGSCS